MITNARFNDFIEVLFEFEEEHNPNGTVRVERDPDDPGGTTKYGIDQRAHPKVDIAALTDEQAREIYFADWTRLPCDELPRPFGELLMDVVQNGGPGAAWIQKVVGVDPDGFIGPKTLAAAAAVATDAMKTKRGIDFFCDQRELRFERIIRERPKSSKYRKGWLRRNEAMRSWAHAHLPIVATT